MKLEGKIALVTGASAGIGRAIAVALAGHGVDVIVHFNSSEREANETSEEIKRAGVRSAALRADLSRVEDAEHLVAEAYSRFGGLDLLVNNAAAPVVSIPFAQLDDLKPEIWDNILNVNVKAAFYLSRSAYSVFRGSNGGAIVNVGSIAGIRPVGNNIAYACSKAALDQMTRCLAVAMSPVVRVNCVLPGAVLSGRFSDDALASRIGLLGHEVMAEDVASVVVEVLSNGSMTGTTVTIDAGAVVPVDGWPR
jgi:3-oxoacyl-[acyl-carrier protein] reductase